MARVDKNILNAMKYQNLTVMLSSFFQPFSFSYPAQNKRVHKHHRNSCRQIEKAAIRHPAKTDNAPFSYTRRYEILSA